MGLLDLLTRRPAARDGELNVTLACRPGGIELTCTKGHVYYLEGHPSFRVGSERSPIAYVRCPYCFERVTGGRIITE